MGSGSSRYVDVLNHIVRMVMSLPPKDLSLGRDEDRKGLSLNHLH